MALSPELQKELKIQANQKYALGLDYYYGRNGKPQDLNRAGQCFGSACSHGLCDQDADAHNMAGLCELKGYPQDPKTDDNMHKKLAFIYFRAAAKKGSAVGAFNTSLFYRDGCTVEQDTAKEIEYLEMAAKGGYVKAQMELAGRLRSLGKFQAAYSWYEIAAKNGEELAKKCLVAMDKEWKETADKLFNGGASETASAATAREPEPRKRPLSGAEEALRRLQQRIEEQRNAINKVTARTAAAIVERFDEEEVQSAIERFRAAAKRKAGKRGYSSDDGDDVAEIIMEHIVDANFWKDVATFLDAEGEARVRRIADNWGASSSEREVGRLADNFERASKKGKTATERNLYLRLCSKCQTQTYWKMVAVLTEL